MDLTGDGPLVVTVRTRDVEPPPPLGSLALDKDINSTCLNNEMLIEPICAAHTKESALREVPS